MVRILDLYCGMGGLSLGFLAGLDGSEALGLDIDRYAVMTYNHNLERFNARAEVQDILEWEPRGEYDIIIGGVPCFPPETMVVTTNGLKEIKNIGEGDETITHMGRIRKIIKVMKRRYKGRMVKLRLSLLKIPILVTPDHPFYVIKTKPCSLGLNMPCTPTCNHEGESRKVVHYRNYGKGRYEYVRKCKKYYELYKPEWVEADLLEPKRSFVLVTLPSYIEPPTDIPLEPEMWYVFGMYVTEGTPYIKYVYKKRRDKERGIKRPGYMVYFSLGKHETNLINKLVTSLRRLGFNPSVREHTKNTVRVVVYSKKLFVLVTSIFGKYAKGKKIPIWVLRLPRKCREMFLEGIRDGDGDNDKFVTTVNPNIAFMVWLIALSLGRPASLSRVKMPSKTEIEGRIVNQSPYLYRVHEIKRQDYVKVGRYWFKGNCIVLEVLNKEYVYYDGDVYNLEVEEDNSYEVWGIVVHNCQPYSLANTRKRGKDHPLYPTLPRFFDIVLELRPKAFLMENVRGLVTRRHKPLLLEQLRRVEQDYRIAYKVLNAAYYGIPQRRERLFVLGIRRDLGVTPTFPEPTHAERETMTLNGKLHRWITVREAIGDLLAIPPISYPKKLVQTNPRHGKPISLDEPSRTVKVDGRGGDFTFDTMLVPVTEHALLNNKTYDYDWSKRSIPLDKPSYTITEKHRCGQVVEITEHDVRLYSMSFSRDSLEKHPPQDIDTPSTTIRASFYKVPPDSTVTLGNGLYRRLTVRECLRIQSFPDWWGFPDGISTSRKYRLVGEAVPPILAYRIAVKIGELLGWRTGEPSREVFMLPYYDRVFGGE